MQVYQAIARKIEAMRNCNRNGNWEWFTRHHDAIDSIIREHMPSGSGFDCGTKFDACGHVDSPRDELRFNVEFHHMNNGGYYDGWTSHCVIVRPSLSHGFTLHVTGRDKRGIKEYIADVFNTALSAAYVDSSHDRH